MQRMTIAISVSETSIFMAKSFGKRIISKDRQPRKRFY